MAPCVGVPLQQVGEVAGNDRSCLVPTEPGTERAVGVGGIKGARGSVRVKAAGCIHGVDCYLDSAFGA